jgi:hypothetical protein
MTSASEPGARPPANSSADPLPSWQRLLALSGVAFAVLLVFGWFLSGGDGPDYTASDEDWTDWADDNRSRSGIGAFLVLLAGFAICTLRERSEACWEVLRQQSPAPCSWPALRLRVPSLAPPESQWPS